MRVLVCGGRTYKDKNKLFGVLDNINYVSKITTVITGGARGADFLGALWARQRGILLEEYPADWDKHGRSAGHIRNWEMLKKGKPDLVVAFRGGRGTANMVRISEKEGIEVVKVGFV